MEKLGAHVEYVVVNDLADDTFFARITAHRTTANGMEIDSRPSDAIALAVRVQVPIYAEDAVLERAGVALDQEGKPIEGSAPEQISKVNEEELQRMSAFRDFIESLDLSDLDKPKALDQPSVSSPIRSVERSRRTAGAFLDRPRALPRI